MYGTDISRQAIEMGKKWFESKHIHNIQFSVSSATNLRGFAEKSIDIILTDAVLIFVGPDKIEAVIRKMLRVARKTLILNEWHKADLQFPLYKNYWVYNYNKVFGKFLPPQNIKITKIPEELWPQEGWKKFGHIIEVNILE